jgi:hypothetical protein
MTSPRSARGQAPHVLLSLAVVLFALAPGRRAGADRATDRAAEHFSLAESAERRGDWQSAIYEYKAAYAIKPHPSVLYNIATNYERLGDFEAAAEYFEHYLEGAHDAPDRTEVEGHVRELRGKAEAMRRDRPRAGTGTGTLVVLTNVSGADVIVDGQAVGTTPLERSLPAGPHRVEIRRAGLAPVRREVIVSALDRVEIREYLGDGRGTIDGGDGPSTGPRGPRFGLAFASGIANRSSATGVRLALTASARPARWLELGLGYGNQGRNDRGLALELRWLIGRGPVGVNLRGAATVGTATTGRHSLRTYGVEGGVGLIYTPALLVTQTPTPSLPDPPQAPFLFEYRLDLGMRATGGGVAEEVDGLPTPEEDRTVPVALIFDFVIGVRL